MTLVELLYLKATDLYSATIQVGGTCRTNLAANRYRYNLHW